MDGEYRIEAQRQKLKRESVLFVAIGGLLGREVIGSVSCDGLNEGDPWVSSLFVTPGHERQGIGRDLLGQCVKECERQGKERVAIYVAPENKRALKMYLAAGFQIAQAHAGGDIFMVKQLNPLTADSIK